MLAKQKHYYSDSQKSQVHETMAGLLKKTAIGLLATLLIAALLGLSAWFYLRFELTRAPADPAAIEAWFSRPASLPDFASDERQPCTDQWPQRKAFFGALHIHTAASFDATAFGVTNDADDAYAFSRGKTLELRLLGDDPHMDVPTVTIDAPLDFAAVTDHAGQLGEKRICENPTRAGYGSLLCRVYRGDVRFPVEESMQALVRLASQAIFKQERSLRVCGEGGGDCREEARDAWEENLRAAESWQDRSSNCEFTTFPAYEYTLAEEGSNLHRNVIFAGASVPPAVVSAKDMQTPELLWEWLREACLESGNNCDVLTIPHNSNWSSGRMWFPYSYREDLSAEQQRSYAALRAHMEPLAEIMQVKGDSECRNGLSTVVGAPDEFCDFEKLRAPSEAVEDCGEAMGAGNMRLVGCLSRFSYARYALSTGLSEEEKLGVNPFRLGIVAATDNHNATATAGFEQGYMGANGPDRDVASRLRGGVEVPGGIAKGSPVRYNPGGFAGVWAQENSRESLFAAMRRRETFGTSGPRIEPRLFASWDFPENICDSAEMIEQAYERGVPMGSELPSGAARAPVFLTSASRDANGHLLQRIQIIKGWVDADGKTHQAVYDVAGNPDNGASVDTRSCEVSGSGYNQLCSLWRDPDFKAQTSAVYYARVLENPSCRWSTYQCNELPASERPASCSDPDVPKTIQERAWTSPIWYSSSREEKNDAF
jgi:hypothetical protein